MRSSGLPVTPRLNNARSRGVYWVWRAMERARYRSTPGDHMKRFSTLVAGFAAITLCATTLSTQRPGRELRRDTREIRSDRRELRGDKRELRLDRRHHDRSELRSDRHDFRLDRRDLRQDRRDRRRDWRDFRQTN